MISRENTGLEFKKLSFRPCIKFLQGDNLQKKQKVLENIYIFSDLQIRNATQLNSKIWFQQIALLAERCIKTDSDYEDLIHFLETDDYRLLE